MTFIKKIEEYGDTHHPKWLSFVRIVLGLIVMTNGILLISDRDLIINLYQSDQLGFMGPFIVPFVAPIQIVFGLFIAIGLMTRLAVFFQLPILLWATFFVNLPQGQIAEFVFSFLVTVLLLFFFVYGSGHYGVGKYMKTHKDT